MTRIEALRAALADPEPPLTVTVGRQVSLANEMVPALLALYAAARKVDRYITDPAYEPDFMKAQATIALRDAIAACEEPE